MLSVLNAWEFTELQSFATKNSKCASKERPSCIFLREDEKHRTIFPTIVVGIYMENFH